MVLYKEAGVELVQARGQEGRFLWDGQQMRLGAYRFGDTWQLAVQSSTGGEIVSLSLDDAQTLKEASDMLRYGFFLRREGNESLISHLEEIGLLTIASTPS